MAQITSNTFTINVNRETNTEEDLTTKVIIYKGVNELTGARVFAKDLRGGAALVLSGLAAQGVTEVENIYHINYFQCKVYYYILTILFC